MELLLRLAFPREGVGGRPGRGQGGGGCGVEIKTKSGLCGAASTYHIIEAMTQDDGKYLAFKEKCKVPTEVSMAPSLKVRFQPLQLLSL